MAMKLIDLPDEENKYLPEKGDRCGGWE